MPRMRLRVDWGLGLVMLSFCPMMRLRSVDLPALGFPTTATIPARVMGTKVVRIGSGVVGGWEKGGSRCSDPPGSESSSGDRRGAGDGLLSRALSGGVPSALQGLTTVFGMGTGVAPAL